MTPSTDLSACIDALTEAMASDYRRTFRQAGGGLPNPFLVPGSQQYDDQLWDWDSWLTNVALRQIVADAGQGGAVDELRPFERGCILNFVDALQRGPKWLGWMPPLIGREGVTTPPDPFTAGVHKPCLAQHAAMLVREDAGQIDWLGRADGLYALQALLNYYRAHRFHPPTGLYLLQGGGGNGVDDDPTSFGRPPRSCGSISLNCMMYREYEALVYLLETAGLGEVAEGVARERDALRAAIREHCWDERDGFYYSVDLNLLFPPEGAWANSGRRRHWDCLIMRLGVWSGFMAMWAGLATDEQARRMVEEHYRDERTFNCPAGVRTLSKLEKMYLVRASGNPSGWRGPVWGIANYMTWRGLVRYGYVDDARQLAERTIRTLGRGLLDHGELFEYYQPDDGQPILNPGFRNWNQLVMNMIAWLQDRRVITEF